jgi:hypothetical protein
MRKFAENTSVPVSRSRGEIDKLLREWKAGAIQWSDDFAHDTVTLRFVWEHQEVHYLARFKIQLADHKLLEKRAYNRHTGRFSQFRMDALLAARGRQEHRVLLLWLKASLNAVEAGLVDATTLFLPFLEGRDGSTVAEVAMPRLSELVAGSAARLLTDGRHG